MKVSDKNSKKEKKRKAAVIAAIFCSAAVILTVLLIFAAGVTGGNGMGDFSSFFNFGKKTVGKNISTQEITDFYYTYATSTDPPDYQRYRFYVENGEFVFYHEKREGDHWPLTDADITVSGTVTLSDSDRDRFFECISGGSVEKRKETADAGGSGPWLYIYWKRDRSKYQEFSFGSTKAQLEFEALCSELTNRTN